MSNVKDQINEIYKQLRDLSSIKNELAQVKKIKDEIEKIKESVSTLEKSISQIPSEKTPDEKIKILHNDLSESISIHFLALDKRLKELEKANGE